MCICILLLVERARYLQFHMKCVYDCCAFVFVPLRFVACVKQKRHTHTHTVREWKSNDTDSSIDIEIQHRYTFGGSRTEIDDIGDIIRTILWAIYLSAPIYRGDLERTRTHNPKYWNIFCLAPFNRSENWYQD